MATAIAHLDADMAAYAALMREQVIRPTLDYLGIKQSTAEELLVAVALLAAHFDRNGSGLGPFHISVAQHRTVWDEYLAFNPNLASEVRGLASQRCFLQQPDRELVTNLAYATAIAWILISTSGLDLPARGDTDGQVRLWQRLFGTEDTDAHPEPAMASGGATATLASEWLQRQARAA